MQYIIIIIITAIIDSPYRVANGSFSARDVWISRTFHLYPLSFVYYRLSTVST